MEDADFRLLRRAEVEVLIGLKTAQLYRLMKRGKFPLPVKLGSRAVRWKSNEIRAWLESQTERAVLLQTT